MKLPVVGNRPHFSTGNIQPLLLFILGAGFMVLGMRVYPAFIAVGCLFVLIGYRGYTHRRDNTSRPD
jgi:hypothetical protein